MVKNLKAIAFEALSPAKRKIMYNHLANPRNILLQTVPRGVTYEIVYPNGYSNANFKYNANLNLGDEVTITDTLGRIVTGFLTNINLNNKGNYVIYVSPTMVANNNEATPEYFNGNGTPVKGTVKAFQKKKKYNVPRNYLQMEPCNKHTEKRR